MSKLKHTLRFALASIRVNQARSFLTILGIVIGVASIIIIMSLGQGAQGLILSEVNQMGAETVVILPGDMTDPSVIFSDSLTNRDITALRRKTNVPNLSDLMPVVVVPGGLAYRGETYRPAYMIGAIAEFFGSTFNVYPSPGTIFSDMDVQNRSRVVIIGSKVKEELFGASDALGERITIKDTQFRIIGVYPKTGQRSMFDIDDLVLMPYTTAQTYLLGTNYFHRIIAKADSPSSVERLEHDIVATLRESHGLHPGQKDDFSVMTQQGLIDQISTIMLILTSFLASVVAISLVVGGIGVMNIMLVSVTERTQEIGLRKALGATRRTILRQFLWEAIVLTTTGGVIGIIVGAFISFVASLVLAKVVADGWAFTFPVEAAILGVLVSAGVGVIFGLYPAKRAADKSPIEALRYE